MARRHRKAHFFKCGAQQCFPYLGYVTYIWTITRLMRISDVAVLSIRTPFREASAISSFLKSACQSDTGSWLEMMRALRLYLSSRICSKSFCCCPSIGFIPKSSMMMSTGLYIGMRNNGNRQDGKGQLILIYEQYFASRLSTDMSPMRNLLASRGRILSLTGSLPL